MKLCCVYTFALVCVWVHISYIDLLNNSVCYRKKCKFTICKNLLLLSLLFKLTAAKVSDEHILKTSAKCNPPLSASRSLFLLSPLSLCLCIFKQAIHIRLCMCYSQCMHAQTHTHNCTLTSPP